MNRQRVALLVILVTASVGLAAGAQITFEETLRQDEYPKLKKKLEKKLENIRGKD